jgi:hypothetical protein
MHWVTTLLFFVSISSSHTKHTKHTKHIHSLIDSLILIYILTVVLTQIKCVRFDLVCDLQLPERSNQQIMYWCLLIFEMCLLSKANYTLSILIPRMFIFLISFWRERKDRSYCEFWNDWPCDALSSQLCFNQHT